MNYLLIGLLFGLGFGISRVCLNIIEEIIIERLHNSDTYRNICRHKQMNTKTKKQPYKRTEIGFTSERKIE